MSNHIAHKSDATRALEGVLRLLKNAPEVESRNGLTRELTHVSLSLGNPRMRELLNPSRKANLAAQIAETAWVLAGRNDIEWLSNYLPRAKDFSDDGKTWRAGYGPRIRNWRVFDDANVDQLDYVIRELRANPLSRQAVISIWDPVVDTEPGKDKACLAGDTVLWSPEGDLPVAEVAAKFKSGGTTRWPVYAVDPVNKEQRITWATDVWQSGVKRTIKVNFDDGSSIRLTPDHRLYLKPKQRLKDGSSVREIFAGDLKPGDRILATRRWYTPEGYEFHKVHLDKNTGFGNRRSTHQAYAEMVLGPKPDGYEVDHINRVKTDNRAENLQYLTHSDHAKKTMSEQGNPMKRMPEERRAAKGAAHSIAMTGRKHSEETKLKITGRPPKQPDNHVVVSVEDGYEEPVYDFTVPGEHTALVGTGVVAHNCNDFLMFTARNGYLELNVTVRSNDVIWGWSGINQFEWSVLQEIVAGLLGLRVGRLHFNIASLHIYQHHWAKAERILETGWGDERLHYSPTFRAAEVDHSLERFDLVLEQWFVIEEQIRTGGLMNPHAVDDFPEPMLQSWLRVLQWWWSNDIKYLAPLQGTRLYEAALVAVQPKVKPEPEPAKTPVMEIPTETEFLDYVRALHAEKHAAYGDSWKKRGQTYSIIPNIARKVDRLGGSETSDETSADTAIDLAVYLAKYRLWRFEEQYYSNPGVESDLSHVEQVHQLLTNQFVPGPSTLNTPNLIQDIKERFEHMLKQRVDDLDPSLIDLLYEATHLAYRLWTEEQEKAGSAEYRGADADVACE